MTASRLNEKDSKTNTKEMKFLVCLNIAPPIFLFLVNGLPNTDNITKKYTFVNTCFCIALCSNISIQSAIHGGIVWCSLVLIFYIYFRSLDLMIFRFNTLRRTGLSPPLQGIKTNKKNARLFSRAFCVFDLLLSTLYYLSVLTYCIIAFSIGDFTCVFVSLSVAIIT